MPRTVVGQLSAILSLNSARFNKGLGRAKRNVRTFTAGISKNLKLVAKWGGVLSAVALGGGLGLMIAKSFKAIDNVGKLSDTLNISTRDLASLQFAAEQTGASTAEMNKALQIFVRRLGEAKQGLGEGKAGLENLGLDPAKLAAVKTGEAFRLVADRIQKLTTAADKAAAAYQIFGRQGVSLLNVLQVGRQGVDAFATQAERLGIAVTRIEAAKIEAANDAFNRMRTAMTGVVNVIARQLAPLVEELSNRFTALGDQAGGIRAEVLPAFRSVVEGTALAIEGIDKLIRGFKVLVLTIKLVGHVASGNLVKAWRTQAEIGRLADESLRAPTAAGMLAKFDQLTAASTKRAAAAVAKGPGLSPLDIPQVPEAGGGPGLGAGGGAPDRFIQGKRLALGGSGQRGPIPILGDAEQTELLRTIARAVQSKMLAGVPAV